MDERQEFADAQIAAGRARARRSRRAPRCRRCCAGGARRCGRGWPARGDPRPARRLDRTRWCRRRRIARAAAAWPAATTFSVHATLAVAGRSTSCRRTPDSADAPAMSIVPAACRRRSSAHADARTPLEDRERLRLALLLEVDRGGKTDFDDGDAGGRLDREHGRDQSGIARLVRLHVHPPAA